jgi:hypothetical protein
MLAPSFTVPVPGVGRDVRLAEALTERVESARVALDTRPDRTSSVTRPGGNEPTGLPITLQTSVLRVVESTV